MGIWQLGPARGVSRGLSLRALLLLGSTVVLLIVGLLGVHALAGSTGGHTASGTAHDGAAHASTSVVTSGAQQLAAVSAPAAPQQHAHHLPAAASPAVDAAAQNDLQCAETCAGVPLGHEHIAVACVLALLAGLLLLTPPRSIARAWMPAVPALTVLAAGSTQIGPPPPSLVQLSISRT